MAHFGLRLLACVIIASPMAVHAEEPKLSASSDFPQSATKARDIGGFSLGMHIRDVGKSSPLESLGNDEFQTVRAGINYDFAVTPKGRIYRITSNQSLGRFEIDRPFLATLSAKLAAKYGQPTGSSLTTFGWSLIEPVKRIDGKPLPFETNWAAAMVSNGMDGVTVEMKMLDFRILWQDQNDLNRTPRNRAAGAIAF